MKLKDIKNNNLAASNYTVIKLGAVRKVRLDPEDNVEVVKDNETYLIKDKGKKYFLNLYKKGDDEVAFLERA